MTNREAFDEYLHERIASYSAKDKASFLREVLCNRSYYQVEMINYAAHYDIDIYDVEQFSQWLDESSGVDDTQMRNRRINDD